MKQTVVVHPRVCERHPELSVEDVLAAWNNCLRSSRRSNGAIEDYVAVGIDGKGRAIEMIAVPQKNNTWKIYHAMAPPTLRVLQDLGLYDRRKNEQSSKR